MLRLISIENGDIFIRFVICLICFFTSQSIIFQLCPEGPSSVEPVLSKDKCVLLKDTTQWRRWGSNSRPLGLESSTLPLSHCAPWFVICCSCECHFINHNFWIISPIFSKLLRFEITVNCLEIGSCFNFFYLLSAHTLSEKTLPKLIMTSWLYQFLSTSRKPLLFPTITIACL